MYSSSPVEDIKARLDIIDVLGEYIRLTKAGTNFRAICPFHREKSPSFMASKEKQIWHCFGCDEGGDIFGFVMRMEGIEFPEALKILAQKAHIELQPFTPQQQQVKDKRVRLLEANAAAAQFYHEQLWKPAGADALTYVRKRGLKEETIKQFLIGYSPDSYAELTNALTKKGFSRQDLADAGLIVLRSGSGNSFDRFRDRVMFPLKDYNDQVVGFTGRILHENQKNMGKYVNTPETMLYHKGRMLYGLEKAKSHIRRFGYAIIVEGQMDVIASHEAGVGHTVGSSGTALTLEQLSLLKRFTSNLLLAFDADAAGQAAAKRGIELAMQQGFMIKIITIPNGKDPDECIRTNPQDWLQAIKHAKLVMDYYVDSLLGNLDPNNVLQKKRAAGELLAMIAKLSDPIEQTHYIQKLSLQIHVSEQTLHDAMRQAVQRKQQGVRDVSAGHVGSQQVGPEQSRAKPHVITDIVEQEVMGLALTFPELIELVVNRLVEDDLRDARNRTLYSALKAWYTKKHLIDLQQFRREFALTDQEINQYIDVLLLRIESQEDLQDPLMAKEAIQSRMDRMKIFALQRKMRELEQRIREAEIAGNRDQLTQLSVSFTQLSQELSQLTK